MDSNPWYNDFLQERNGTLAAFLPLPGKTGPAVHLHWKRLPSPLMTNESPTAGCTDSHLPQGALAPSSPCKGSLRRFRFNLPQRIAAGLLLCLLVQGVWAIAHSRALPGSGVAGDAASGSLQKGVLAYQLAGIAGALAPQAVATWAQRLPFLAAACLLGGALWWVTRRQFGNLGGYTALALYCFSPAIIQAAVTPAAEILAALGVYAGIYTAIGVAHAMQGPRRKWKPRLVLLALALGLAAAAQPAALLVTLLLGFGFMRWIAEGRRALLLPLLLLTTAGALVLLFASCGFSSQMLLLHLSTLASPSGLGLERLAGLLGFGHAGLGIAAVVGLALYATQRRSRFFGNTVPLVAVGVLVLLAETGTVAGALLWSLPFLFTFIAGTFADAYEGTRPRLALVAGGAIVLLQAAICIVSLPGILESAARQIQLPF